MRALRVLFVLISLAGLGGPALADEIPTPEALQAANELFAILSGDMMKQLIGQMTNAFWPTVEEQFVEEQLRVAKVDDATVAELRKEFDRIELAFLAEAMKEAPPVYARHFSVSELKELTAFYRTPIGAKALHEMPQVTGEFMTVLVPRLQDVQRQTSDAFNRILRERGYVK
jgi:hypothetical protein